MLEQPNHGPTASPGERTSSERSQQQQDPDDPTPRAPGTPSADPSAPRRALPPPYLSPLAAAHVLQQDAEGIRLGADVPVEEALAGHGQLHPAHALRHLRAEAQKGSGPAAAPDPARCSRRRRGPGRFRPAVGSGRHPQPARDSEAPARPRVPRREGPAAGPRPSKMEAPLSAPQRPGRAPLPPPRAELCLAPCFRAPAAHRDAATAVPAPGGKGPGRARGRYAIPPQALSFRYGGRV